MSCRPPQNTREDDGTEPRVGKSIYSEPASGLTEGFDGVARPDDTISAAWDFDQRHRVDRPRLTCSAITDRAYSAPATSIVEIA
jgi:hypothetical protein